MPESIRPLKGDVQPSGAVEVEDDEEEASELAAEPEPGATFSAMTAADLPPIAPFDVAATAGGLLLQAVEKGFFEAPAWVQVEWQGLLIEVGAHALRSKVGDRLLRLPVSWLDVLTISRKLGWTPPTSGLSDAIWKAATVRVPAMPFGDFSTPERAKVTSKKMHLLEFVKIHNERLDAKIPKERFSELTCSEGKDWILSKRNLTSPKAATTYGWHGENGTPIQGLGPDAKLPAHDDLHFDQTQVLRPIKRQARRRSDGAVVDLLDEFERQGIPAGALATLRKK